jgi:hypothetical protein
MSLNLHRQQDVDANLIPSSTINAIFATAFDLVDIKSPREIIGTYNFTSKCKLQRKHAHPNNQPPTGSAAQAATKVLIHVQSAISFEGIEVVRYVTRSLNEVVYGTVSSFISAIVTGNHNYCN